MVSIASIAAMFGTVCLCFGVPVALYLLLRKNHKGVTGVLLAGALGFFLPQMLIRLPLLRLAAGNEGIATYAESHKLVYILILALTAGLCETAGRMFVFKLLIHDKLSYRAALAAGAGHGSIEAIALVGFSYINNIYISLTINSGSFDRIFSTVSGIGSADAAAVKSAILSTPAYMFLFGGAERMFAIAFHIALSLLLLYFILKHQPAAGFLLVMLLHTFVDFTASAINMSFGAIRTEAFLLLVAVLSVIYSFAAKKYFKQTEIPQVADREALKKLESDVK